MERNRLRVSQMKPSLARNGAGVVLTIIIGIAFFFAITETKFKALNIDKQRFKYA
jgi:hypothetical protein